MLFGKQEMREFAETHSDKRVKSMMRKIDELTSKIAQFNEALIKAGDSIKNLKDEIEAIQARGKVNAQERIALIQENMDLKKRLGEMKDEKYS